MLIYSRLLWGWKGNQRHIVDLDIHRRRSKYHHFRAVIGVYSRRIQKTRDLLLLFVQSSLFFHLEFSPTLITPYRLLATQSLRTVSSHQSSHAWLPRQNMTAFHDQKARTSMSGNTHRSSSFHHSNTSPWSETAHSQPLPQNPLNQAPHPAPPSISSRVFAPNHPNPSPPTYNTPPSYRPSASSLQLLAPLPVSFSARGDRVSRTGLRWRGLGRRNPRPWIG